MREKRFISYEEYGNLVNKLSDLISHYSFNFNYIYGIERGGFPIAVHLSHHLNIPFLKPSEYFFTADNSKILIVDDICDTGATLKPFINRGFRTATIFYKQRSVVEPLFFMEEVDKWIVFPWEREDEIPNREE